MSERVHQPSDLELAALISSKICHDVIGPVSAINNGLEILDEEDDAQAKNYALDVIRNVTETASARLQFARFAFGAAGSAGSQIDLGNAESLCRGFMGEGKDRNGKDRLVKHRLVWRGASGQMDKDKVKLLLNMVAAAPAAIPRGGDIEVGITGGLERPSFSVRCRGVGARPPQYLGDFVSGSPPPINAMSIQAYYTLRLAASSRMRLDIVRDGADIVLLAKPHG
jgi:histidine phosphotransferase ChpT